MQTNTRLPAPGQLNETSASHGDPTGRRRTESESSWDQSFDQMEDLSSEDVLSRSGIGSTPRHSDKEAGSSEDEVSQPPSSIMISSKSH